MKNVVMMRNLYLILVLFQSYSPIHGIRSRDGDQDVYGRG
jgi:hypothetical protein